MNINYKWNIEKDKCFQIAYDNIIDILKNIKKSRLEINELIMLLNEKTHNLLLKNNLKKKTITNFLKTNCKGIIHFIEMYDDLFILREDSKIIFSMNLMIGY
jgi:uncharacterized membrane protein